MGVASGQLEKDERQKMAKKQADEERKLGEMMIPKKKKNLYKKIVYGQKRKTREVRVLGICCNETLSLEEKKTVFNQNMK